MMRRQGGDQSQLFYLFNLERLPTRRSNVALSACDSEDLSRTPQTAGKRHAARRWRRIGSRAFSL
jgi:hypothetical protein